MQVDHCIRFKNLRKGQATTSGISGIEPRAEVGQGLTLMRGVGFPRSAVQLPVAIGIVAITVLFLPNPSTGSPTPYG